MVEKPKRLVNIPNVRLESRGRDCIFYLSTNLFFLVCFPASHSTSYFYVA